MSKTALITGATSGIGWETALLFAKKGYRVVALGRNQEALQNLQRILPGDGHLFIAYDLMDLQGMEFLVRKIAAQCGTLDVLVNNAGQGLFTPLIDSSLEQRERIIRINLLAPMELGKQVLLVMKKQSGGAIVNVASVAGKRTFANLTAYCASKFGLIGFSNSLRRELKRLNIPVSVSVVCPPAVRTNFFKNAGYAAFEKDHSGLRLAEPAMVARAILEAVRHKKREVIITPRAKILDFMAALFPSFTEWLEDQIAGRKKQS